MTPEQIAAAAAAAAATAAADTAGTSLLEDAAAQQADQQGSDQGDGAGSGDAGGAGPGVVDVAAITAQITKALEAQFDSIADRRVNALLKAQKKADAAGSGGAGTGGSQPPEHEGPNVTDVREARAEYREAVADEIAFLGVEERSLASDLSLTLIHARLTADEDPATAGIAVARDVAARIKALRKHYEDATVAQLRRKGLLAPDGRGDGQVLPGSTNPGGESGFKAGADKAAAMFASRAAS